MNVNTNKFEAAHGKKPRGRGCWMFELSGHLRGGTEEFMTGGTYAEAKQKAMQEARDGNYTLVTLMA